MTTAAEVLAEIEKQLAWRGPTGRSMGHIVIEREPMAVLVQWIKGNCRFSEGNDADEKESPGDVGLGGLQRVDP